MSKIFNLAVTAAILLAPAITVAQPTYDINFTLNPPIIDGIVSPGEWDEAAAEQGGWRILRNPDGPQFATGLTPSTILYTITVLLKSRW